jgi:hypothetical protein
MVLRTAGRGQYVRQQFWGRSTFPACRARIGLKPVGTDARDEPEPPAVVSAAGASAQVEYERYRQRNR